MKSVEARQRQWFSEWARSDDGYLPSRYPRTIVLLHPGTVETDDPEVPFKGPDSADDDLSDEQTAVLDRALLDLFGPEKRCTFARYGGYLDDSHRHELLERGLERVSDRLTYYLGAGTLSECLFTDAALDAGGFLMQSFLWADDRSWFISSMPDLAFTVVGCDDDLAGRLLAEPELCSRECPELPSAGLPNR